MFSKSNPAMQNEKKVKKSRSKVFFQKNNRKSGLNCTKLHVLKMMMMLLLLLVDLETRDDDFLMITGKRRMMASEVGSEERERERSGKQMRKFELMS